MRRQTRDVPVLRAPVPVCNARCLCHTPIEKGSPGECSTVGYHAGQHCWICKCRFIIKGGRVWLEHRHDLVDGMALARGVWTPICVAGVCRVCNGGVLYLGDVVRQALGRRGLTGGQGLAAALEVAVKLARALRTERKTWAECL